MHNFSPLVLKATENIQRHATKEINAWLRAQLIKQVDPNQMVAALVRSGKTQETASLLVNLAMQDVYVGQAQDERIVQRVGPNEVVAPHAEEHWVDAGDRKVRKLMSMGSVDVVLYENFLSDAEIEHLKSESEPFLQRSKVVGPGMSNIEVPIRTSEGTFLDTGHDPIVSAIEERVAKVTGVPATHGEGLQILRYRDTQEYKPHYDFFEPNTPEESRKIEVAGNRIGTMIFYLSEVEKGGSTYFPQLKLSIHPKRGSALWFGYMGADGVLDMRSEHAGLPVIEGEKWIATKWLRARPIPALLPMDPGAAQAGPGNVLPFQQR